MDYFKNKICKLKFVWKSVYVLGYTLDQVCNNILISTFLCLSWEMVLQNRNGQESFLCVLWESELGTKVFHKHHSSLMTMIVWSGSYLTARTSGAQTLEIYFKSRIPKWENIDFLFLSGDLNFLIVIDFPCKFG